MSGTEALKIYGEEGRQRAEEGKARNEAIKKYGDTIGSIYHEYTFKGLQEGQDERRNVFAIAIVQAIESGSTEEKINAISALLESKESNVQAINNRVGDSREDL